MKVFTKDILAKLAKNGLATREKPTSRSKEPDHFPVVKLFGGGACTWLLTESDPDDPDRLFGLCDLGLGFPELGYVSKAELLSLKFPPFGLSIERDKFWKADKPLSAYADEARAAERIVA